MKIIKVEDLQETSVVRLLNGDSIKLAAVMALDHKRRMMLTDDLNLTFSDGAELLLPYGRNYRNTSTNDVIIVENDTTEKLIFSGGLIAHVVLGSKILLSVETAYRGNSFPPVDERQDFNEFQAYLLGGNVALVWDFGVVIFDKEFNVIEKREKYADDILESKSLQKLVFKSSSDGEVFEVGLA